MWGVCVCGGGVSSVCVCVCGGGEVLLAVGGHLLTDSTKTKSVMTKHTYSP